VTSPFNVRSDASSNTMSAAMASSNDGGWSDGIIGVGVSSTTGFTIIHPEMSVSCGNHRSIRGAKTSPYRFNLRDRYGGQVARSLRLRGVWCRTSTRPIRALCVAITANALPETLAEPRLESFSVMSSDRLRLSRLAGT
jgi:hypothetical protein